MRRFGWTFVFIALGCGTSAPGIGGTEETGSSSGSSSDTMQQISASDTGVGDGADDNANTGAMTTMAADDTDGTTDTPTTADEGETGMATTDDAGTSTTDATTGDTMGATTGKTGDCGDGSVNPGEQCDGEDLQGFDCASLGLGGGSLACDTVTCTFDTSMCTGSGSGGTSG